MFKANSALLIIDVQNDFLPGGALAVAEGDQVIPIINQVAKFFDNIALTQDWHPSDHISFAYHHEGKNPFETVTLAYGEQTLWPSHCVQGTHGAALADGLQIEGVQVIIRKGYNSSVDSYSAFLEADKKLLTGLAGYLRERSIHHLYLCGLATDYCVAWSALDAKSLGFEVTVIEDATRAIDLNGSLVQAWLEMERAGVNRVQSKNLLNGL
jgi:nicotinamidase/pyrazinamidase